MAEPDVHRRGSPRLPLPLLGAVVASGAAGLIDEIAWIRILSLEIGATAPALSWVLATFFGGLALGSLAGARWRVAARIAPRLYALAEVLCAGFAASSPAVLIATARALGSRAELAALWLFVPTFVMGLTLPLLCRAAGADGRAASRLYAWNTLGGAAGAALAGYVLLEMIGLRGSVRTAAVIHLCAGALSLAVTRVPDEPEAEVEVRGDAKGSVLGLRACLAVAFVTGAVSIAGEVVLNRMLYQVLGGSTYAITCTLVVFLVAVVAGAAIGSAGSDDPGRLRGRLVVALLALAAAVAGAYSILLALRNLFLSDPAAAASLTSGLLWTHLTALGVLAPPALASGLAFPWLVRLARREGSQALGLVYGVNTVGAIAASMVTTYVLVPRLGLVGSLSVAGAAAALAAAAVAGSGAGRVAGAAVAAAALVSLAIPARSERLRLWLYDALAREQAESGNAAASRAMSTENVVVHVEGVSATATVTELVYGDGARVRDFAINGKKEASTGFEAQRNQLVLGHLPMLLHPDPKRALVVGLGAGVTAGAVAVHPGAEVIIAELSPEVAAATRAFAAANHGVLDRANVEVRYEDGRRVLAERARGFFDVITSDPIHPWISGAANLYTYDYFELVRNALAPGGVAVHWLPLYEMALPETTAIGASFRAAFPNSALWITYAGDAVLLGARDELRIDAARFAERARQGEVANDLKSIRLDDPLRLLAGLVAGAAQLAPEGTDLVTDDRQVLEFRAARNLFLPRTLAQNLTYYSRRPWSAEELINHFGIDPALRPRLQRLMVANLRAMEARGKLEDGEHGAAESALEAWVAEPDGEQLGLLFSTPEMESRFRNPQNAREVLVAAAEEIRHARRSTSDGMALANKLRAACERLAAYRADDELTARAMRRQLAVWRGELRDYEGVLTVLREDLSASDADPSLLRIAARALTRLGRPDEARALTERAHRADLRGL
ncbi:MAG: fused MFS/spermidine synthase [Planctomycetes bacterium]|nr:fused MFS/spermidine synthase [Planctomycetota bacterium]